MILVSGQGRGAELGGPIWRGLLEEVNEEWAREVGRTFSELLKPMPWGGGGQECLAPACRPRQWGLGSLGAGDSLPLSCGCRGGLAACLLLTRNTDSLHSYLLTCYCGIPNPKPPSGGSRCPFGPAGTSDLRKLSRAKAWKGGRTLGSSSPLSACLGVGRQTMSPSAIPTRGYPPGHTWSSSLVSA